MELGRSWARRIILPGMGDSSRGSLGSIPGAWREAGSPCLPGSPQAGAGLAAGVQGCSLSADGNALLLHGTAACWHFGDTGGCWGPPSPGGGEKSHREKWAQSGELSSGSSFSGLCGSCCSSSWGWDCSSCSFQSIHGVPPQRAW